MRRFGRSGCAPRKRRRRRGGRLKLEFMRQSSPIESDSCFCAHCLLVLHSCTHAASINLTSFYMPATDELVVKLHILVSDGATHRRQPCDRRRGRRSLLPRVPGAAGVGGGRPVRAPRGVCQLRHPHALLRERPPVLPLPRVLPHRSRHKVRQAGSRRRRPRPAPAAQPGDEQWAINTSGITGEWRRISMTRSSATRRGKSLREAAAASTMPTGQTRRGDVIIRRPRLLSNLSRIYIGVRCISWHLRSRIKTGCCNFFSSFIKEKAVLIQTMKKQATLHTAH
jgi:hypothetical protein